MWQSVYVVLIDRLTETAFPIMAGVLGLWVVYALVKIISLVQYATEPSRDRRRL